MYSAQLARVNAARVKCDVSEHPHPFNSGRIGVVSEKNVQSLGDGSGFGRHVPSDYGTEAEKRENHHIKAGDDHTNF